MSIRANSSSRPASPETEQLQVGLDSPAVVHRAHLVARLSHDLVKSHGLRRGIVLGVRQREQLGQRPRQALTFRRDDGRRLVYLGEISALRGPRGDPRVAVEGGHRCS